MIKLKNKAFILFPTLLLATLISSCAGQNKSADQSGQAEAGADTTSLPPFHASTSGLQPATSSDPQLATLRMPPGFSIEYFAKDITNARSLELCPNGTLFVGTRNEGNVYALVDSDGDYKADKKYLLDSRLNMPNGVAYKDGDLYVATVSQVLLFRDIESKLDNPGEIIYDEYPTDKHHGWKYIAFGPDGMLYIPVGAPCNICLSEDPVFASITRFDTKSRTKEIIQRGIRNTVGFNWHPETGELWFTDNGRDWMGDNQPPDELNRAPRDNMHFGYPFCHGGDLQDPEFDQRSCDEFTPPVRKLGPHVASLGMEFGQGSMFPAEYNNDVLIAEHGSWNRSTPLGYRITHVPLDGHTAEDYRVFIEGWLQENGKPWGRPVDLEWMEDGSLLISDDFNDAVYRVVYTEE